MVGRWGNGLSVKKTVILCEQGHTLTSVSYVWPVSCPSACGHCGVWMYTYFQPSQCYTSHSFIEHRDYTVCSTPAHNTTSHWQTETH